jgi:chemotaxis-related protein WspB
MLVLTFQVGSHRLALDIHQVREVAPRVELNRPPGSPAWLAGMFVYRGRALPVIDLHRLLGAGECPPHLSSRIILVPRNRNTPEGKQPLLVGLLAAGVADLLDVQPDEQPLPAFSEPGAPDLGLTVVAGGDILHLITVDRLLPEPIKRFLDNLPSELPE